MLVRMAPLVRFGIFSLGVSLFLDQAQPLLSDARFTWSERRIMGVMALMTIGGATLAAWVIGHLLRTSAELIDVVIDGVEANERTADLIEQHMVPALNRLASALERGPVVSHAPSPAEAAASAARKAIEAGRWGQAERLVVAFARDFAGSPERARLADELAEARQAVIDALQQELDRARAAGNAKAAIDARDALTEHLRGEPLHDLDAELVHWLYGLIQTRVRAGAVSPETAALAERVADSFADTTEGAKLRAALAKLRKSAGLCPQCGRSFQGTTGTCPRCQSTVAIPTPDSEATP